MNFPTLDQVSKKSKSTLWASIHNYKYDHTEDYKVKSLLKNKKSILQVDTAISFENTLRMFDVIFGRFVQPSANEIIFRGKIGYKETIKDSQTGQEQDVFSISDPKSLYRKVDSQVYFIRVPKGSILYSGVYAQISINPKVQNNLEIFSADPDNVQFFDVENKIPTLFLDYSKFSDVFKTDYGFDMSETVINYRRNLNLTNIDHLMMNKIAGENFHNDIGGAINCNVIKTRHEQGSRNLEILDEFLDKVTISNNTETVFNKNLVHSGKLEDFKTVLNKNNRVMPLSKYKNYYGCNIGFSLGKLSHSEEDGFMEELNKTSVDYMNPIGSITTQTPSTVRKLLKINPEIEYSSKILFAEVQLLPIKTKVSELRNESPNVLRMANIIKKFEGCIYDLGTDEVHKTLQTSKNDIEFAKKFLKENKQEVEEFIKSR